MSSDPKTRRSKLSLPLWMGAFTGAAIALIVFLLPTAALELAVERSGLASVMPAAAPPLGQTARGLLAAMLGGGFAIAVAIILRALEGLPNIKIKRRVIAPKFEVEKQELVKPLPVSEAEEPVRRAPILATQELGAPFHSIVAPSPVKKAEPAPEPVKAEPVKAEPVKTETMPAPKPIIGQGESLSAMMQRLETGFERRRAMRADAAPAAEKPLPLPVMPDIDSALRDALGTLQKMSARAR